MVGNALGRKVAAVVLIASATGLRPPPVGGLDGGRTAIGDAYVIKVKISDDLSRVEGWVSATRVNTLPLPLRDLHLRLYPNAFKPDGEMSVIRVTDDRGRELSYEVTGPDDTVLVVHLAGQVGPGEGAMINVSFEVEVPWRADRFGRSEDLIALGNWFPILSVRRGSSWLDHPYFWIGESFVSASSNVTLTVTYPSDCDAAATGERTSTETSSGWSTSTWRAEGVRDAALVVMRNRKEKEVVTPSGVMVECYYREEHERGAELALTTAERALQLFGGMFGGYPYRTLEVVEVPAWFAGMEYPGLIMISEDVMSSPGRDLETVVAHEVSHQWWYALVGNDQWEEPWLDEGLATYSECLYFEGVYGEDEYREAFDHYVSAPLYRYLEGDGIPIRTAADAGLFDGDEEMYAMTAYARGAWVMRMLRYVVGDETFFEGLRRYVEERSFDIATTPDLERAMEEAWGRDLSWFFDEWVYGAAVVSYSVEARESGEGTVVTVTPRVEGFAGEIKMPVEVEFRWDNGSTMRKRVWVNGTRTLTLRGKCVEIIPDPDDEILGEDVEWIQGNEEPGSKVTGGWPYIPPCAVVAILVIVGALSAAVIYLKVVRPPGFEPGSGAWQAPILSRLDYGRAGAARPGVYKIWVSAC